MKKCPVCSRVYSDTVELCPLCDALLAEDSVHQDPMTEAVELNMEAQASQILSTKADETATDGSAKKTKQNRFDVWKITAVVSVLAALLFAGLYAGKASAYNDLLMEYGIVLDGYDLLWDAYEEMEKTAASGNEEYQELSEKYTELEAALSEKTEGYEALNEKCQELEKLVSRYDLEGRYRIEVTDCFNSDDKYNKISDSMKIGDLDCICFKWTIHDDTEAWDDVFYADIITPDGEVFSSQPEKDGHTWKTDVSDTTGTTNSRKGWFRHEWIAGTYRVIFYQGSEAVGTYEIEVR